MHNVKTCFHINMLKVDRSIQDVSAAGYKAVTVCSSAAAVIIMLQRPNCFSQNESTLINYGSSEI